MLPGALFFVHLKLFVATNLVSLCGIVIVKQKLKKQDDYTECPDYFRLRFA